MFLFFASIFLTLLFISAPAYAYIGPAIAYFGYLLGPLGAILLAVGMIVIWPLRRYYLKKREAVKNDSEPGKPENKSG